jgi:hypothetical protein
MDYIIWVENNQVLSFVIQVKMLILVACTSMKKKVENVKRKHIIINFH